MQEARYSIEYTKDVEEKQLPKLSREIQNIIIKFIDKKLRIDPYHYGKALKGNLKNYFRLRVGDYRMIYKIDDHKIVVFIIEIGHRKEIYDK